MHQWSTKVVMDPAFESTNWLIQKLHWLFSVPVFDAISMTTRMIILKELVSKTTADWWWLVAMTGWHDFPETVGNGIIIPTDELIFFGGGETTNQVKMIYIYMTFHRLPHTTSRIIISRRAMKWWNMLGNTQEREG
jgi:hypothetical protein